MISYSNNMGDIDQNNFTDRFFVLSKSKIKVLVSTTKINCSISEGSKIVFQLDENLKYKKKVDIVEINSGTRNIIGSFYNSYEFNSFIHEVLSNKKNMEFFRKKISYTIPTEKKSFNIKNMYL